MINNFIETLQQCSSNDVFLLAVSGGPDSMAMLHMLKDSPVKFVVCNVNYKTREASDYEEEMVKNYSLKNNMLFESCVAEKNEIKNFQDSARVFRYAFFKKVYEKYNAKGLVVAHHLDDALETYLMQKKRESIVRHYGIAHHSLIMDMNIYRPLLNYRKNELLNYCIENQVPYSIDYTNNLPKYQRNKLRIEVINNLSDEEYNTLVQKMHEEEQENNYFFNKVDNYLNSCKANNYLDVNIFRDIPESFKIYVLYSYLQPLILRSSRILSKNYLKDLIFQIENCNSNKKYILNKKYFLYQEYNLIHLEKEEFKDYCYYLNKDEEITTPYFSIKKNGDNKNGIYIRDDEYPIMIRNFKDGDEISLPNGHKMLRRWFIDKKVPLSRRKKIPLLFNNKGKLLFIPSIYKNFERKNLNSNVFVIE